MALVRKMRLRFPLTVAIIVQLCAQTALTFSTDNLQTVMLRHLGLSEPPHLEKRDLQNVRVPARVRAQYGELLEGQRRRARRDVPSLVGILRDLSGNVDIAGDVLYSDPTRQRLLFEMKGRIADNSEVTLAELRLFKVAPLSSELRLHRRSRHNARVSILWVEALPNGRNRTSIVDSRLIPVEDSGWKSFDVTDAVHLWMRTRDGPMQLEVWIEAERPGRRAADMARLVRFTTQVHAKSSVEKPEIIIYSIDLAEYGAREDCNQAEPVGNDHRCCRRDNYINFRELSWTQYWVIEPAGYHAYECAGGCKRPPRGSHARGERACAVVESSPLPMMYLVKKGDYAEIEVAEFPNMVVQKCGCAQNSAAIV